MKILITNCSETTYAGGVHKAIKEIAKNLSLRGHNVTVLQTNPFNLPKEEYYEGFKIIRIKSRIGKYFYDFSPEMYLYLKKNFTELNPDIIHVHGFQNFFSPELLLTFRSLNIQIPVVMTLHYDPLNRSKTMGKIFGKLYDYLFGKWILNLSDYVISISKFEAKHITKLFDYHCLTVIPHGVDYINTKKKSKNENFIKLIYVGYLLDYKGVQSILKALKLLVYDKKVKKIKLTIIGEGKFKKNLLKISKELNVDSFIIWKNFLPNKDVLDEIRRSDIFLLLSKTEGYGIVVAEALAMGTPSIVTKRTALEEFINEPGCFGVSCPPDPEDVVDLILKIYDNDVIVGPFSKKIRTWDEVAEDYEKVYLNLLRRYNADN